MPETSDSLVTPAQLTAGLAGLLHGPYADTVTAEAGDLAAETARYLAYAGAHGGITDPATIANLTASLAIAIYRMPQLLHAISAWLDAETAAGRIADDHRRPPAQLTDRARAAINQAADNADALATSLAAIRNLTATLHATSPGAPTV
ncbi:MAG TPA: hypothetical protein VHZ33_17060 [Trebonia sp.]|jgi:hypothetical protein|nr:hypothetical protein [Trebonia sp.]